MSTPLLEVKLKLFMHIFRNTFKNAGCDFLYTLSYSSLQIIYFLRITFLNFDFYNLHKRKISSNDQGNEVGKERGVAEMRRNNFHMI